ncbi:Transmembrane emp24 domain-containing protein 10 [Knufia obscura]|uniref:Transmembrane emp24 domain-containing protein 10 n=2 Tax=Knufia TaxID=430999 RepID=A0AAN8F0M0_9EURO|nr:Transmembrane emp24 domain-containing protein 10 [Knufia obscura]KAK5957931.1 Transmembrane emp24 domain-containing protein 10 [Knufia fluminis]
MDVQSIDLQTTIPIVLEDTGTIFNVHKDFICAASPFVKGCVQKGFKEEEEQKVTIREWQNEGSLKMLILWIYRGKSILGGLDVSAADTDKAREAAKQTAELYVLADRFVMAELKNDITDHYRELTRLPFILENAIHYEALKLLAEQQLYTCQLARYIVHELAIDLGSMADDIKDGNKIDIDTIEELKVLQGIIDNQHSVAWTILQAFIENLKANKLIVYTGRCDYHEHEDGVKRCESPGLKAHIARLNQEGHGDE